LIQICDKEEIEILESLNQVHSSGFPKALATLSVDQKEAVILEKLPGRSLKEFLLETDPSQKLSVKELSEIFAKIILLVRKIHSAGYTYNNIEPEHVYCSPYFCNDDSVLAKTGEDKIIQKDVSHFIGSNRTGSKTFRMRSNSKTLIKNILGIERNSPKRHFEVSIMNFTASRPIEKCSSSPSVGERNSNHIKQEKEHESNDLKIPPTLSKLCLSKMYSLSGRTRADDLKDVCYLFCYCLLNSRYTSERLKKSLKVHEFALEIFKVIYSKTKYSTFKSNSQYQEKNDYTALSRCLIEKVNKLPIKIKDALISFTDPDECEEISEFYPLEKLGHDQTFDARIGNRFTRKTMIKYIYNRYYSKEENIVNPRKDLPGLSKKSSLQSQSMKGKFTNLPNKNIPHRICDDSEDTKNNLVIAEKLLKKNSKDSFLKQDAKEKIDPLINNQRLDKINEEDVDESDSVNHHNDKSYRESHSSFVRLLKNPNNQSKLSQSHRKISNRMDKMDIFETGFENIRDDVLDEGCQRNPTV